MVANKEEWRGCGYEDKVVEWSIGDVGGAFPSNMVRLRVRVEGSCSAVYGHRMGLAPSMAHILPRGGCCYPMADTRHATYPNMHGRLRCPYAKINKFSRP